MGTPKALVSDEDGPWLPRGVRTLLDGGCDAVVVVLGAAVEEALPLLPQAADLPSPDLPRPDLPQGAPPAGRQVPDGWHDVTPRVSVVAAEDWAEGMSASLRAGLGALADTDATAALVHLVDLPDVGPDVVRRVIGSGSGLARAAYLGVPGHPVLLGREHWAPILAGVSGDRGARDYLRTHETSLVECGELATGEDVDSRA
jgi:CTP:molybdopterin cytidylyltransferase MocA